MANKHESNCCGHFERTKMAKVTLTSDLSVPQQALWGGVIWRRKIRKCSPTRDFCHWHIICSYGNLQLEGTCWARLCWSCRRANFILEWELERNRQRGDATKRAQIQHPSSYYIKPGDVPVLLQVISTSYCENILK